MKKRFNVWIGFLSIIIVVACSLAWLFGTNQGAQFSIERIARTMPANIQIGNINGKLAGGLEISDINVQLPAWEISAKRLYVRWNPFHLLGGWIGIREVSLEDVVINDLYPEVRNPYDLSWPHAKGLLSWIKARIKLFHLTNIIYKEAGQKIQKIEKVQAQIVWYLGELNVRYFHLRGSPGIIEGSIGASFTRTKLNANFKIKPDIPLHGLNLFQFKVNLDRARDPHQISGPMTLIGMSGNNEQVKLAGIAAIAKETISLDKIEFKEMGRPGIIEGNASFNVSLPQRPYEINFAVTDVSISKNHTLATSISGKVVAKGDIEGYGGSFNLKNIEKSWKEISLEGKFQGDSHEIKVTAFKGSALNGVLGGAMKASWTREIKITGTLEARNLNPALITPDWPGTINADFVTDLRFSGSEYPEGTVKVSLHKSIMRKKPLTGTIDAQWKNGSLALSHCELHGNGFDISAQGILQEKIDYQVKVTDLRGLIPEARGRFLASGWLRWTKEQWAVITKAEGHALSIDQFKIDSAILQAQLNEKGDETVRGTLQTRNAVYGPLNLGSQGINVEGKLSGHDFSISLVWPKSSGTIVGHGGYKDGSWQGTLSKMEGKDSYAGPFNLVRPVTLNVSGKRISVAPLILTANTGESIEIAGEILPDPAEGHFNVRWNKLNLARGNQFLSDVKLDGQSSGSFEGHITDKERLRLNGSGSGTFSLTKGPVTLRVSITTKLNADEKGMRASWLAGFQGGGRLEGHFDSSEPAYFKKPESGSVKIAWSDLDVATIKPWLPQTVDVKGRLSGNIQGKLLTDSRFELFGDSKITGSSFTWRNEGGMIASSAENASLDFQWRDQGLKGNLDVRFPSHGKVKSTLSIPMPARFPLGIEKTGNVDIAANGEIREKGIVSSLFPGLIEESRGQFSFEFRRTGTWESPDVKGRMRLENAAAYLPASGTRIKEGTMDATFVQDRIELTSFVARSGPGKIEGSGTIWLKKLGIDRFKIKLEGYRFQAIYLPELQVQANPELTFEGDSNKVQIRGTLRIPEALARDSGSKASVRTSQDVVIIDAPQKEKKPLKTEVDVQATVVLGDKVRIQVEGLEGRMEGSVLLTGHTPDTIIGKGTIRIVNGKYNSYGIKLDVTRGNIIFDGGPVDRAALDIMAIRIFNPGKFDEIKAGVTVTGTLMSPLIKLYSEPPMTDTDVLSYMVLGRPIRAGAESNQTALLLKSASAILGGSKATGVQDQLQQRLGIDTLDVQEGPKSSFTSSARTKTTTSSATLDNSLMTVGKYISPDLYVSYGRSLFNDQFLVSARYNLTKKLELESKAGIATSVDLYYKIEFD